MAVLGCSIVASLGRADEEFGFQESEHPPFQFWGGIEVLETEESLWDVIPAVRIELQVFDGSLADVILRKLNDSHGGLPTKIIAYGGKRAQIGCWVAIIVSALGHKSFGIMRRAKALPSSGCESRPATIVPAVMLSW